MLITVFTPSFNRGYVIENLYRSLQKQTFTNFEWIVIDDGSSDNTEELFYYWRKEKNKFNIYYQKVENGGKHRAINKGLELANGKMFFIVDSDDYLADDALEKIAYWLTTIEDADEFCGVSGLRGKSLNQMTGTSFRGEFADLYYYEREKNQVTGDKAEVYFTDILRKYRFPEFKNENFVTEAVVWMQMGARYKMRYFNEIIYLADYLVDGLSRNIEILVRKNPQGHAFFVLKNIEYNKLNLKQRLGEYFYYNQKFQDVLSKEEVLKNLKIRPLTLYIANLIFSTVNNMKKILK